MIADLSSVIVSAVATSGMIGVLFKLLINKWYDDEQKHKEHVLVQLAELTKSVDDLTIEMKIMKVEAPAFKVDILDKIASLRIYFQEKFTDVHHRGENDHTRIGKLEDDLLSLRVELDRKRPHNNGA